MVENLTDDALDVIIDIVMATQKRLARRLKRARVYWIGITRDWWCEWCDRSTYGHADMEESNATIET